MDSLVRQHTEVVHFAAESHVDRSFLAAGHFLSTNVLGTQTLLEAANRHDVRKFVHVSTDEVYGPLATGAATEEWPLRPTVPYAASKAASDMVARSYFRTFGVPVCITRSSNNYGPPAAPREDRPIVRHGPAQGRTGDPARQRGSMCATGCTLPTTARASTWSCARGSGEVVRTSAAAPIWTNRDLTGLLLAVCRRTWDDVATFPTGAATTCATP